MLMETQGAARDLGRINTILGVLIRHGLGDAVRPLGLVDSLERAGRVLHWDSAAYLARLAPPVQVRLAIEELGPTFVKLGQILAGRADLFGPEWIAEFVKLHSHVQAVPLERLRPQLLEDLGGELEAVFAHFDPEPLAAASIAQVHRARLHDGTEVVVKIHRPGIGDVITVDLRLAAHLTALVETELPQLRPYRPQQIVRELDLASECGNAERLAANRASLPFVVVPRVHWAFTRERVNVQDFVDGIPGHALAALDRQGWTAGCWPSAAAVAEQLPHDVSRLLRNARRGRVHVGIELALLKRVGDQIDRAANRLTMALVIAALIIGSSIVMTVQGGPTLFGLPAFGFLGFASAFISGLWLVRAMWRSSRGRDLCNGDS